MDGSIVEYYLGFGLRTGPLADFRRSVGLSMPRRPLCHPIRLQPQRRSPQRRLDESALPRPKQPLASVLFQQPGPAQRPKHLHIEAT